MFVLSVLLVRSFSKSKEDFLGMQRMNTGHRDCAGRFLSRVKSSYPR